MSGNYIQSYFDFGPNHLRNQAVYTNSYVRIVTGYYQLNNPPTIVLSDVTSSSTITIIDSPQSDSYKVDPNNANGFFILLAGSYTFLITYTDTVASPNITYSSYVSFTCVKPIELPSQTVLYNNMKRAEMPQVYTQSTGYIDDFGNNVYPNEFVDVNSNAAVFAQLYQDVGTLYQNILPSGGSPNWEVALNATNGLLSNTPTPGVVNPYYSQILQMLYSLQVNNTGNKFDASLFLSKYLYYRSNGTITAYVCLDETAYAQPDVWVLDESQLDLNTVLAGALSPLYSINVYFLIQTGTITQDLADELTNLCPKLFAYGPTVFVSFSETLSSIGLTQSLGQTWKFDPRLGEFGILYQPGYINQAQGYANPTAPQSLTSLAMTPASGTIAVLGTQPYVVTGTYYSGATKNVTGQSVVSSSNPSVISITAPGTLSVNMIGTATITFSYGVYTGTNTYTVT